MESVHEKVKTTRSTKSHAAASQSLVIKKQFMIILLVQLWPNLWTSPIILYPVKMASLGNWVILPAKINKF